MDTRRITNIFGSTANIAALSQVQSSYIDVGRKAPRLEILRSAYAGGTYVFEIDWSNDGTTQLGSTDTVAGITTGTPSYVVPKARYARLRIKNTHATNPFTSHNTQVGVDSAAGRR